MFFYSLRSKTPCFSWRKPAQPEKELGQIEKSATKSISKEKALKQP